MGRPRLLVTCIATLAVGATIACTDPARPGASASECDGGAASGSEDCSAAEVSPQVVVRPIDGVRLKMTYAVTPGGLEAPVEWYDRDLQQPCSFRRASGGELHCLPSTPVSSSEYWEEGCAGQPVMHHVADSVPGPLFFTVSGPIDAEYPCRNNERYFRAGERLPPETRLFQKRGSDCVFTTTVGSNRIYRLGEEVPVETFVRGTRRTKRSQDPGAKLALTVVEAQDGALEPVGWQDLASGKECQARETADGKVRCLPHSYSIGPNQFAGPTCREPTVSTSHRPSACWPAPEFAARYDDRTCRPQFTLYELGPRTNDVYHRDHEDACVPVADRNGGEVQFHTVGRRIPPERFGVLEQQLQILPGQRLAATIVSGGGGLAKLDWLYDIAEQAPCKPLKMDDGTLRCINNVNVAAPIVYSYADPACQELLFATRHNVCLPSVVVERWSGLEPRLYRVGAVHVGKVYRIDYQNVDECYEDTEAQHRFVYQRVHRVPPEEFPEVRLEHAR